MSYLPGEIVNVNNTVTHTGNGATTLDVFTLTGVVRVHEIFGIVTQATNATTFQKVGLILYESTPTTVEITDIGTGVDGSSVAVGSVFIRANVTGASNPLILKSSATCGSVELMYEGGGYGLVLTPRQGATNTVKVSFTGDADTDVDIQWYAKYTPLTVGASLVAA
jgi:hypothetical protein